MLREMKHLSHEERVKELCSQEKNALGDLGAPWSPWEVILLKQLLGRNS